MVMSNHAQSREKHPAIPFRPQPFWRDRTLTYTHFLPPALSTHHLPPTTYLPPPTTYHLSPITYPLTATSARARRTPSTSSQAHSSAAACSRRWCGPPP